MTLKAQITTLLGREVSALRPLHGGDLSEVLRADLSGGKSVVVKRGAHVGIEAHMLRRMLEAGAPVPEVLAAQDDLLAMAHIPEGAATEAAWRGLGRDLRAMHDVAGAEYGWPEGYAFGAVQIGNRPCASWPAFWAERRLRPLARHLPGDAATRLDRVIAELDTLLPETPPPALLHGDLWTGNVHFGADGRAWMIDPACYYGDAEVDLAMLCLFGRPPQSFFDAYGPLPAGWETRRAIYQLWPALVHVALFGAGYHGMVAGLLDRLAA
ncbi:fructosamine kinase family protein [Primorskyibacter aestuariivivens]|uniref:fructosamine kinase family protein n=1 Tax=Primorskyibacter aestuariivivens TaxID=1888912 RepID=UPI002301203E|nr:fructosamine kinase family protein [Primorskyibacter aestuariivivens]MDA7430076.1 fructosamine kinase family protein [Primorskyibacter aestuariivivens]